MKSAPNTTSGRARPHRIAEAQPPARVVCRRFIRFRIMSSPGLQRQMQVRHQTRLVRRRKIDQARHRPRRDVQRRQPQARQLRHKVKICSHERAQAFGAPGRSAP